MRMVNRNLLPDLAIGQHFAVALAHAHPLDDLALVTLHLAGSERAASKPWPALDLDQLTRGDSPLELGPHLRQPRRAQLRRGVAVHRTAAVVLELGHHPCARRLCWSIAADARLRVFL